jgi:hypothetical protein
MELDRKSMDAQVAPLAGVGLDVRGVQLDISDRPAVHRAFDETTATSKRVTQHFSGA